MPYRPATRPLAAGLLAASFTGFWPLANVIGLLGVTVGLATGAFGVIVAVVAVVLEVLFCIALSRFIRRPWPACFARAGAGIWPRS